MLKPLYLARNNFSEEPNTYTYYLKLLKKLKRDSYTKYKNWHKLSDLQNWKQLTREKRSIKFWLRYGLVNPHNPKIHSEEVNLWFESRKKSLCAYGFSRRFYVSYDKKMIGLRLHFSQDDRTTHHHFFFFNYKEEIDLVAQEKKKAKAIKRKEKKDLLQNALIEFVNKNKNEKIEFIFLKKTFSIGLEEDTNPVINYFYKDEKCFFTWKWRCWDIPMHKLNLLSTDRLLEAKLENLEDINYQMAAKEDTLKELGKVRYLYTYDKRVETIKKAGLLIDEELKKRDPAIIDLFHILTPGMDLIKN